MLGVVALTVYALLRRFRPAPDSVGIPSSSTSECATTSPSGSQQGDTDADFLLIPALIMRLLFPVDRRSCAVFLFLRGHDLPGGGFVAGLTMAIALILQYMAGGTAWVEARLRISPLRWIGLGLLLAAGTGAGAWLFGRPFLTSYFAYAELPLIGAVPTGQRPPLRPRRVRAGGRRHRADADRAGAPVGPQPPRARRTRARGDGARADGARHAGGVMELILALGIGVLAGSGVWLLLRPRTFQVIIGLSLLSYAVNLFIFAIGAAADRHAARPRDTARSAIPRSIADPLPQALVLTAIVISFATTALFLVVLLAARGLTGTDHVDGREPEA